MYLEKLNPQQRAAVEYGTLTDGSHVAGPLLVIAGAGSGKTNTLAHRVAHLIVKGADPRRILLMTFSRRAAAEMARRVERICAQVLGSNSGIMADALAGAEPFTGSGRGSCATTPSRSASTPPSRSMTGKTAPI